MEDESGKNKALGVPGLMLAAGRHVIEDVKGLPVSYTHLTLPTICSV